MHQFVQLFELLTLWLQSSRLIWFISLYQKRNHLLLEEDVLLFEQNIRDAWLKYFYNILSVEIIAVTAYFGIAYGYDYLLEYITIFNRNSPGDCSNVPCILQFHSSISEMELKACANQTFWNDDFSFSWQKYFECSNALICARLLTYCNPRIVFPKFDCYFLLAEMLWVLVIQLFGATDLILKTLKLQAANVTTTIISVAFCIVPSKHSYFNKILARHFVLNGV